jgi:hypothetical protein
MMDINIKIALLVCFFLAKGKGVDEFIQRAKKVTPDGQVDFVLKVLLKEGIIELAGGRNQIQLAKSPRSINLAEVANLFVEFEGFCATPQPVPSLSGKTNVQFLPSPFVDEFMKMFSQLTLQDAIERKRG